ncbi:hypothetical protein EVA_21433 [gut metagenome]|uniref:Uncharacterized protein n=1 Tax=gut metagenome TaxID=749906 RepID=J9BSA1_9ZZZZ
MLVRDEDHERWQAALYDQYIICNGAFPHHVIGGENFAQCIPYEGNEKLLGTSDAPKAKRWKPKERETYFTIHHEYGVPFYVVDFKWDGSPADEDMYRLGNCFRTEEEAQKVTDKFNALLKGEE